MVLTLLKQPRKSPSPLCQTQCLTLATKTVTVALFLAMSFSTPFYKPFCLEQLINPTLLESGKLLLAF